MKKSELELKLKETETKLREALISERVLRKLFQQILSGEIDEGYLEDLKIEAEDELILEDELEMRNED